MIKFILGILVVFLASFASLANAETVVTRKASTIYEGPSSRSSSLTQVPPGTQLVEIGGGKTKQGYWHVELGDGQTGWIYRGRVRHAEYSALQLFRAGDCERHLIFGIPKKSDVQLCRVGYAAGFNTRHLVPDWVAWKMDFSSSQTNGGERKDIFEADLSIEIVDYRVGGSAYSGINYDRGHMADSSAIDATQLANDQTFLMTNMTPQRPWFNRDVGQYHGVWGAIEDATSCWVKLGERKSLYIIAGVILSGDPKKIDGRISVPEGFWKVIIDLNTMDTISFLIEDQEVAINDAHDAAKYIVTISDVQNAAGVDLNAGLEDDIEGSLESQKGNLIEWPLYDRRFGRCEPRV